MKLQEDRWACWPWSSEDGFLRALEHGLINSPKKVSQVRLGDIPCKLKLVVLIWRGIYVLTYQLPLYISVWSGFCFYQYPTWAVLNGETFPKLIAAQGTQVEHVHPTIVCHGFSCKNSYLQKLIMFEEFNFIFNFWFWMSFSARRQQATPIGVSSLLPILAA